MADWFRNATWNDSIERKRNGFQYLRIQANTLARSHPEVALKLLDRYFELPENFGRAQAFVDRATALLALGRVDEAILAYNSALVREASFPNVRTRAYLDLPYLIARQGKRSLYDRALEILKIHQTEVMFAVDLFLWNAVHALIALDLQKPETAKPYAERALEAASRKDSGLRYHPSTGLVTEEYSDVIGKLRRCSAP